VRAVERSLPSWDGNRQTAFSLGSSAASDGNFYLAIWVGVEDADPDNPSTIYNITPQNVTFTANTPIGGEVTYVLDDSGNMTSTSGELTNGSLPITVTDRLTLIALSPGRSHSHALKLVADA
jgi:hypothetical protein